LPNFEKNTWSSTQSKIGVIVIAEKSEMKTIDSKWEWNVNMWMGGGIVTRQLKTGFE
jgi:hypothetical protein